MIINAELEWEEFINLHQISVRINSKKRTLFLVANEVANDEISKFELEELVRSYLSRLYSVPVETES